MAAKKPIKRPTMEQAYKAAKKSTDKGIVGEGKDVLKATGNSVKQQAEFVAAVGKGAAKGAGAIAKGAGKVAGKVADITVGDVASAPLDSARAVAKGAGKVAAKVGDFFTLNPIKKGLGSMAGKKVLDPMKYTGPVKMGATAAAKGKDAKANKARQATDSKYDKVKGTPKSKQKDPGMYKPKGGTPVTKDPGMYKPRGKNPGQSGGRPSQRGL